MRSIFLTSAAPPHPLSGKQRLSPCKRHSIHRVQMRLDTPNRLNPSGSPLKFWWYRSLGCISPRTGTPLVNAEKNPPTFEVVTFIQLLQPAVFDQRHTRNAVRPPTESNLLMLRALRPSGAP